MTADELIGLYFDLARITEGVGQRPITIRHLSATEIVKILWPFITAAGKLAKEHGEVWHEDAADEVDSVFHQLAESGQRAFETTMSPQACTELFRRYNYALLSMMMEEKQETGYTMAVPADVAHDYAVLGVLIYLAMGIGREYPRNSYR